MAVVSLDKPLGLSPWWEVGCDCCSLSLLLAVPFVVGQGHCSLGEGCPRGEQRLGSGRAACSGGGSLRLSSFHTGAQHVPLLVGLASGTALVPLAAPEGTGSFSIYLVLESLYLA